MKSHIFRALFHKGFFYISAKFAIWDIALNRNTITTQNFTRALPSVYMQASLRSWYMDLIRPEAVIKILSTYLTFKS